MLLTLNSVVRSVVVTGLRGLMAPPKWGLQYLLLLYITVQQCSSGLWVIRLVNDAHFTTLSKLRLSIHTVCSLKCATYSYCLLTLVLMLTLLMLMLTRVSHNAHWFGLRTHSESLISILMLNQFSLNAQLFRS